MIENHYLGKIATIARNTFREAVRDRVLYNLVVFALLIVAAAILLGDLTDGHEARTIVNLGLAAILFFGAFIAIFVGVSLVSKEIEKRTIYAILSKPVSRPQFIVGRYLGLCLTLLVNVTVMALGVTAALVYVGGSKLIAPVWGAAGLVYLELTVLTAVAIVFSSFSSPALSALLTFMVFIIGHFSASLRDFAVNIGSEAAKYFFGFLYYFLPNLSNYSFATNAANGELPPAGFVGYVAAYTVVYAAILIAVAAAIFSRRNFK